MHDDLFEPKKEKLIKKSKLAGKMLIAQFKRGHELKIVNRN